MRSHGSTTKSPVTACAISGSRRIEPVGVSSLRLSGARISGLGDRDERYGFWANPS